MVHLFSQGIVRRLILIGTSVDLAKTDVAKTKEGQNLVFALEEFIKVTLPLGRLEQPDTTTEKKGTRSAITIDTYT